MSTRENIRLIARASYHWALGQKSSRSVILMHSNNLIRVCCILFEVFSTSIV